MEIIDTSVRNAWKKTIAAIDSHGSSYVDSDKRVCIELLNVTLVLKDMKDILSPLEYISQSKKWIYPRPQEIENFVLDGNLSPSFAYSYGERLFLYQHKSPINQIDSYVIPLLKKHSLSRRAVAVIWNPEKDTLSKEHVPGLIYVDFKLRQGKLFAFCAIRSCDCLIGLPANMYELYCLTKYVAKKLSATIGDLTFHLHSSHIFKDYAEEIKRISS